ncbi:probable serine/threonine-protein kinase PBL28 [Nicotiana sylvestris]|uniref:probable serine/threonine-protein kinase PBL28 n=1 Tax=Nicotiana sylvestris TaxID=4096 RepID=UPI00388CC4E0
MEKSLVAIIWATVIVVTILVILVKCILKRSKNINVVVAQNLESPTLNGLYKFTIVEIENAINNIDKTNYMRISRKLIGNGSRGELCQGILPSGQVVAIKEMHKTEDAVGSFITEVECLSRARHPSIVCLLGFCNEDGKHFLVYENYSAGNLAQYFLSEFPYF